MTLDYVHEALPGRVVFGVGAVERVPDEVAALGIERAMVIAGGSSKATGELIAGGLGERHGGSFGDVRQHVPEDLAAAARQAASATGIDGVVAVGGGSAIGLAKAIAVDAAVRIVAVPTTYSGSEMTAIYGITGRHKRTARDLRALPAVVVYDPALTVDLPPALSATSGLNALAHAVEAYYGPGASPVVDLYADAAIAALATALPQVVDEPGDLEARSTVLHGAHLAGRALAVAGTGLHHKLCHVLGGTFGLDHSRTHAVVLPYAVHLMARHNPPAIARVAQVLAEAMRRSLGPAERQAPLAYDAGADAGRGAVGVAPAGRSTGEGEQLASLTGDAASGAGAGPDRSAVEVMSTSSGPSGRLASLAGGGSAAGGSGSQASASALAGQAAAHLAELGERVGAPASDPAGRAAGLVADLAEQVGAPGSLRELGMPAEGIDEAARLGAEATGVDVGELRALLEAAFAGDTTAIRGDVQ